MSTTDHRPGPDPTGEEPPFGDSAGSGGGPAAGSVDGNVGSPRVSGEDAAGEQADRLVDDVSELGGGAGGTHPVVLCVYECLTALESVRDVSTLSLSATDLRTLIVAIARIIAQATSLKLRLLAAGEVRKVAETTGARSTASFLAHATRLVRRKASAQVRLAKDLEYRYPIVAEAFAAGIVYGDQVKAIVTALRRLPRNISAEKLEVAQQFLVDAAQTKNAEQLGKLGKELWEILDPEGAEKHLHKKLLDEEALARAKAYFQSWRNGDGTTGFRGKLPDAQADMLIKVIEAYAAPRRRSNPNIDTPDPDTGGPDTSGSGAAADGASGNGASGSGEDHPIGRPESEQDDEGDGEGAGDGSSPTEDTPASNGEDPGADPGSNDPGHPPPDGQPDPDGETNDDRGGDAGWDVPGSGPPDDGSTPEERETGRTLPWTVILGHGLIDLVNHLPKSAIPQAGGVSASMVVTIDQRILHSGIGAATLDTGTQISASQARQMACTCGILPAVLGGPSQVLDLGRQQRAFTAAHHAALAIRDGGCVAETCDVLPAWCEAHHKVPWALGGLTTLENGCLLCFYHHHLAHDDDWTVIWLPDGQARFRRVRRRS